MIYILVFLLSWSIFAIAAKKHVFHAIHSTALLAVVMSLSSDIFVRHYPYWLWSFRNMKESPFNVFYELADDFGIYYVIAYLYIQYSPNRLKTWLPYTSCWTIGGIILEYVIVKNHHLNYFNGWTFLHSFIADWIIFIILSVHYIFFGKKPRVSLDKRHQKALICLESDIQAIQQDHPLQKNAGLPGIHFFSCVSQKNVETFLSFIEPETVLPTNHHEGYEIHYILDGTVCITFPDSEIIMKTGDIIHFSSNKPHGFKNIGSIPVKLLSVLITPAILSANTKSSTTS